MADSPRNHLEGPPSSQSGSDSDQLAAAIDKEAAQADKDEFLRHHNAKLLNPPPRPFHQTIKRLGHAPEGFLSIQSKDCDGNVQHIETMRRKLDKKHKLSLRLSAATTVELNADTFVHGWVRHCFEEEEEEAKLYQLSARAHHFSFFVLVVGHMLPSGQLDPKHAIIVQNKDEVLIPLVLEELPTTKEFNDAMQSLPPEQQRFAEAVHEMRRETPLFGVCTIEIKHQVEKELNLQPGDLTQEVKLMQDLMRLLVRYQVPVDHLKSPDPSEYLHCRIRVMKFMVEPCMDLIKEEEEQATKAMRKRKPGRDTANEARAKKTRTQPATSSPGPSIAPCVAGDQHNTASAATTGPHFTLLPKKLGEGIAKHDPLRLTSIRTQEPWQYRSKTDILAGAPATQPDIAAMKQDAFHLLETLNGASPMERCVLHIFVCATHRFEDDVMAAARRGDTKPIEELEQSMLLVGSAIHCVPARSLVNQRDLARLQSSMPELMGAADDDVAADTVASTVPSMVVSSPADVAK